MALVKYLDWEVRTTGHDLNCSGFNPTRDTTNGVDYTQQDNAEITSLNWVVDSTNNTWIRSTELTNWVNSGKTLASLNGNHIHIAGKAIGGNTLFQWNASAAVPGAYYLQALGGGNPNWTTKPTIFWMNKTFVLENASLPAGANSWTYGDKDSLGYSTIYVRFGAESDADPNIKAQDDVIADGQTWTRGAYEIVNVGTDGNGPYLVLDRSPAGTGSADGYGRIGGAMASPGGVRSVCAGARTFTFIRSGTYILSANSVDYPGDMGRTENTTHYVIGYDTVKRQEPQSKPQINITQTSGLHHPPSCFCSFVFPESGSFTYQCSYGESVYCTVKSLGATVYWRCLSTLCDFEKINVGEAAYVFCRFMQCAATNFFNWRTMFVSCIFIDPILIQADRSLYVDNCVIYNSTANPLFSIYQGNYTAQLHNTIAVNCTYVNLAPNRGLTMSRNCYAYNVTNNVLGWTPLPGNPFRDPDNGDFRLADNEAGRMLKQAGFQIPGPQGAPPMKFDVGAVQNSFYDISGGGGSAFVLPPRVIGG